jgi:3-hydroxyacyl-[acyl-carrier-protein] dehydratase
MVYSEGLIEASHPSLPGHFPGDPIVPGVLILQRVIKAAERLFAGAVTAVTVAKFHARLKPDEKFRVAFEHSNADAVSFRVVRGEILIASGMLKLFQRSSDGPELSQ